MFMQKISSFFNVMFLYIKNVANIVLYKYNKICYLWLTASNDYILFSKCSKICFIFCYNSKLIVNSPKGELCCLNKVTGGLSIWKILNGFLVLLNFPPILLAIIFEFFYY